MSVLQIVLTVLYIIAAFVIMTVVLLQEGKSAGLGSAFATQQDSYWAKNKKHTLEGRFERWTKISAGAFVALALVLSLIQ